LLLVVLAVAAVVCIRRYLPVRPRPALPETPEVTEREKVEPAVTRDAVSTPRSRPEPGGDWGGVLVRAREMEARDDLVTARATYLKVLEECADPQVRRAAEQRLGIVNVELVFSPRAMPEKELYVVQRGDSLAKIAKRFGTTVGLIQKSNHLVNPNLIKAGDRLRVFKGVFRIEVSTTRNDLVLVMNDALFKRYRVGTGKFGKTPVGEFTVNDKIEKPVWWRRDGKEVPFGDPENILGTHWMSLRAAKGTTLVGSGYGIHGTWEESTIGKAESAGCIRLKNSDVEEIFTLVPYGTRVTILD